MALTLDTVEWVAAVTVLSFLEQAHFAWQVIYARRRYHVSPPRMAGPPEFERVSRAQINCFEYYPLFLASMWAAGVFLHQVPASVLGFLYLVARYKYFHGYVEAAEKRLPPLYFAAAMLRLLCALSTAGVVDHFLSRAIGYSLVQSVLHVFGL
uniref:leukotriene C4 synthase n=1 Tax=Myxine glutinosa TaxID=7769 RepID=UPI00358E29B6